MKENTFIFKKGLLYQYTGKRLRNFDIYGLYECASVKPLMFKNKVELIQQGERIKHAFVIPERLSNRQLMDLNGLGNETNLLAPFNPYLIGKVVK